jgi:hypothetical protein
MCCIRYAGYGCGGRNGVGHGDGGCWWGDKVDAQVKDQRVFLVGARKHVPATFAGFPPPTDLPAPPQILPIVVAATSYIHIEPAVS